MFDESSLILQATPETPEIDELSDRLARQLTMTRVPRATYRVQFRPDFTFRDAKALVEYLDELGISDCYVSPIFRPRAGSLHGYDICDYSRLNPALGSEEDFAAFSLALQSRGMGLIIDVVPNHMGIGDVANIWWLNVLENGPSSPYASYFDIDWHPAKVDFENKVLLPLLDDQYGNVLEGSKFRLAYEEGAFFLYYYDIRLPVAPRTYTLILSQAFEQVVQELGEQDESCVEYQSILTALNYLPSRIDLSPDKIVERFREKEVIKRRIAILVETSPQIHAILQNTLDVFNGISGQTSSFDLLDKLIEMQPYRPAFWRVAAEEINYRRFFDINELAAIRVEIPEVFEKTHQLVFRLLAEKQVTGLRIDHPDGLWDPHQYFSQLQTKYLVGRLKREFPNSVSDQSIQDLVRKILADSFPSGEAKQLSNHRCPLFVVAEKILCEGEKLPENWPVEGTTGYDFLVDVNGLFVDTSRARSFDQIYRQFVGIKYDYRNLVNSRKKMIMLVSMAGEINALAHLLDRISEKNRRYRDFTLNSLTFALREVIACLPVYRTYVTASEPPSQHDQMYIGSAVSEAMKRNPSTAHAIFDFIRDTLLLRNFGLFREEDRSSLIEFVMKFQQMTGPVMAKGVEDTAFYIYNRLVSLNEVGGNPERFGYPVEQFHRKNMDRRLRWPHSLLSTSTHDTKRSGDVRARINVLSEIPLEWRAALTRWSRLNFSKKTKIQGELFPSRNDEYLLYQTLLGVWPATPMTREEYGSFRERIVNYMRKATKEAKVHTSWINPNDAYDSAVCRFVQGVLGGSDKNKFLDAFLPFQRRVAHYGRMNSLSQLLLKLTSPGIPDIYQGGELWNFTLVDPDNRGAVDFQQRRQLLTELRQRIEAAGGDLTELVRELLDSSADGRIKLFVLHQALNYRKRKEAIFSRGDYLRLEPTGPKQAHVCAFARIWEEERIVVVVPRLVVSLTDGKEQFPLGGNVWGETVLLLPQERPGQTFMDQLTGKCLVVDQINGSTGLRLADIFCSFPVAFLEKSMTMKKG